MTDSAGRHFGSFEESHPRLAAAWGIGAWAAFAAVEARHLRESLRDDDQLEATRAKMGLLMCGAVFTGVIVHNARKD